MGDPKDGTVEGFAEGHPRAVCLFEAICALVADIGPFDRRVSKSQVALRRRRGFAYLWLPGRWLPNPSSEVVLSIVLHRPETSHRFKEVAHPAPGVWMHHLEIRAVEDLDLEVAGWLDEAYRYGG